MEEEENKFSFLLKLTINCFKEVAVHHKLGATTCGAQSRIINVVNCLCSN